MFELNFSTGNVSHDYNWSYESGRSPKDGGIHPQGQIQKELGNGFLLGSSEPPLWQTTLLALLFPRLLLGMFSFPTAVSSRIFPSNWNSKLVPVETLGGVAGTRVRNKMWIFLIRRRLPGDKSLACCSLLLWVQVSESVHPCSEQWTTVCAQSCSTACQMSDVRGLNGSHDCAKKKPISRSSVLDLVPSSG